MAVELEFRDFCASLIQRGRAEQGQPGREELAGRAGSVGAGIFAV